MTSSNKYRLIEQYYNNSVQNESLSHTRKSVFHDHLSLKASRYCYFAKI